MKRVSIRTALGAFALMAGLAISGSASAQTCAYWKNKDTSNGTFYLSVSGGEVCSQPSGPCGLEDGTLMETYHSAGMDQRICLETGTFAQLKDFYNDYRNGITPMCVAVSGNSLSQNANLEIWDCQSTSQGPGQYWQAQSAEYLGAPYTGCYAFINMHSGMAMSVSNGNVRDQTTVVQHTLCEPNNGQCSPNGWHPDQFWCPVQTR